MPVPSDKAAAEQLFLGRYRSVRHLGEGGMSNVWLAYEDGSDRLVVVKRLKEEFLSEPTIRETFRREVEFMRNFRHPYAVQLYDSTLSDPAGPGLVMEYADGPSLDVLLQKQQRLAPERVGLLLGQLCAVLEALHSLGYVHADIKPSNIVVLAAGTPDESIKMLDFGLARKHTQATDTPYIPLEKITHSAAGTPMYMSPENIRREPPDPRDDIYSVGVMLYKLLTGRLPFSYSTMDRLAEAHEKEAPPPFGPNEGVSPEIEAVVRSCLAKRRAERPASARDLALAYQEALGKIIWNDADATAQTGPVVQARPSSLMDVEELNCSLEAWMPEQIAAIKLRGFLDDHGAEVTDSVPGMIRVFFKRPRPGQPAPRPGGLLKWLGLAKEPAPVVDLIEMQVHLEPYDSHQSNHLRISLRARVASGQRPADWEAWCDQTVRQLSAYLMAKQV